MAGRGAAALSTSAIRTRAAGCSNSAGHDQRLRKLAGSRMHAVGRPPPSPYGMSSSKKVQESIGHDTEDKAGDGEHCMDVSIVRSPPAPGRRLTPPAHHSSPRSASPKRTRMLPAVGRHAGDTGGAWSVRLDHRLVMIRENSSAARKIPSHFLFVN